MTETEEMIAQHSKELLGPLVISTFSDKLAKLSKKSPNSKSDPNSAKKPKYCPKTPNPNPCSSLQICQQRSPERNRIPSLLAISLVSEPLLLRYHPKLTMTLSPRSKQAIPSGFAQLFERHATGNSIVFAYNAQAHVCTRISGSLLFV